MFGNSTGVETRSKKKKEQSPKSHQKKFAKLKVFSFYSIWTLTALMFRFLGQITVVAVIL